MLQQGRAGRLRRRQPGDRFRRPGLRRDLREPGARRRPRERRRSSGPTRTPSASFRSSPRRRPTGSSSSSAAGTRPCTRWTPRTGKAAVWTYAAGAQGRLLAGDRRQARLRRRGKRRGRGPRSRIGGPVLWKFDTGSSIIASPSVAGGGLLIGTADGTAVLLRRPPPGERSERNEQERSRPPAGDPQHTEVGSVFVSNYPPYSFWDMEQVPTCARGAGRPVGPIHAARPVPAHSVLPQALQVLLLQGLHREEQPGGRTLPRRRWPARSSCTPHAGGPRAAAEFVYVGGGTPSFISAKHLRELVARLQDAICRGTACEEVTFECEPGTLTRPKLEAIREVGVTRLSLGVENFDDRILEENGRAHLSKEIYRVEPWIRAGLRPAQHRSDRRHGRRDAGRPGKTTVQKTSRWIPTA